MRTATIYNFLVESTLIGSLLTVLLLLFRPLCRKTVGNRMLLLAWLLIALRLLLPLALPNPAMNALKPSMSQDAGIRPMADQVRIRVEDTALDLYWKAFGYDTHRTPVHALVWRLVYATSNGKFSFLVMLIYITGLCLSGGYMILQNLRFRSLLIQSRAGRLAPEEQALFEEQCEARGIRPVPVWRVRGIPSSCCCGLLKPWIAVPEDAPAELLPAMLIRESGFIHTRKLWQCLLRDICCAVHWFNPLVWIGAYASRVDCELACDQWAIMPMDAEQRRAYARLFIGAREIRAMTPSMVTLSSSLTMRGRHMKERIRQALHFAAPRRSVTVAFSIVCVFIGLGMFATAEQPSTANLPVILSNQMPAVSRSIQTQEEAETYARSFLALDGIAMQADDCPVYIAKDEDGWRVELYPADGAEACLISFDENGALNGYENNTVEIDYMYPLAVPITNETEAGQQWCAFLTEFIKRNLPAMWDEFEAMTIEASFRMDGEQFIDIYLVNDTYQPVWKARIQVAPVGRILSLTRVEEDAWNLFTNVEIE